MIYSIGYQNLPIEKLARYVHIFHITMIVDVRSVPYTRHPDRYDYNKNRLLKRFARFSSSSALYVWKGDVLGGKTGPAKEEGITWLIGQQSVDTILLLCLEEDPAQCHRRYDIARRLLIRGIDVSHLCEGRVPILESQFPLQEALDG
jgi:uncharacterized protein (DUF488 family)